VGDILVTILLWRATHTNMWIKSLPKYFVYLQEHIGVYLE
jgi:hypothetical protein